METKWQVQYHLTDPKQYRRDSRRFRTFKGKAKAEAFMRTLTPEAMAEMWEVS